MPDFPPEREREREKALQYYSEQSLVLDAHGSRLHNSWRHGWPFCITGEPLRVERNIPHGSALSLSVGCPSERSSPAARLFRTHEWASLAKLALCGLSHARRTRQTAHATTAATTPLTLIIHLRVYNPGVRYTGNLVQERTAECRSRGISPCVRERRETLHACVRNERWSESVYKPSSSNRVYTKWHTSCISVEIYIKHSWILV